MQRKAAHIRPKVVGPFLDPAQAGATCIELPFYCEHLHLSDYIVGLNFFCRKEYTSESSFWHKF